MIHRHRRAALLSSTLAIYSATLWADAEPAATSGATSDDAAGSALQEIIVTATRTGATQLQRTPIAVSVFSADALSATHTSDIADLAQLSPSLNVGVVTASPSIYIRGVGTNNVFNGSDPDVTMQVDGVYVARPFEQFTDFFDVERIEVLRGPQGTIYGRNAVGGVVNVISKRPSDSLVGSAQVSAGDYDAHEERLYVSGPVVPGLLNLSLAANHSEHGAYNDNLVPNVNGVGDANSTGARFQALWTPASWINATTRLDYGESEEDMQSYDHLLIPAPIPADLANSTVGRYHTVALDAPGMKETRGWGAAEDITFTLNDNLSLRSLTAYRHGEYELGLDFDATEFPAAVLFQSETSRQFSQEFNLTGTYGDLEFVAGLYYLRDKQDTFNEAIAFVPGEEQYFVTAPYLTAKSEAAFLQGTYHLPYGVGITVGGRYTKDTKKLRQTFLVYDFDGVEVGPTIYEFRGNVEPDFSAFTPKVGIDWQITDDALVYASYTAGWKSGGTNYAAIELDGISFDPEEIKSYEVGAKTQWLDGRLRFNLAAFTYDYTDLQVQQALRQGVVVINNAATADVKGVEVELLTRIASRLEISASATYLDATYDKFPGSEVPEALAEYLIDDPNYDPTVGEAGGYNAAGKRLNNAPELAYAVSTRYEQPLPRGELYALANYRWQDETDFDPSNAELLREPAYGLLTVGIGYNSPGNVWNLQALLKNATDEDYYLVRAANGFVPTALSGPPRTFTFSISRNF